MTTPLTDDQVKDLKMMANPSEWPVPNMLAMQRITRDPDNYLVVGKAEPGTLVYADMVMRFVFWPGLSFHMSSHDIEQVMAKGDSSGPLLAYQLEDLIREGWEVD